MALDQHLFDWLNFANNGVDKCKLALTGLHLEYCGLVELRVSKNSNGLSSRLEAETNYGGRIIAPFPVYFKHCALA